MNTTLQESLPLVSVCIPTFNAAKWILDCLNSALGQSYRPLEILVVDDASTDNTVDLLRSIKDERIRLVVNERNLGLVQNWNRCVELSRGSLVKFLFQDDLLYPLCVEKMMRLFLGEEKLGLVFSPRDIILDADKDDPQTVEWIEGCTLLHTKFTLLGEINSGRQLFLEYLAKEFRGNWIGEPSSVMIKKECFDRLGLFNVAMYQNCDVEMWLRIIFFYDAGFVHEKLSAFRFHPNSASHANIKSQRHRLDHVRLLDGLLAYDEIRTKYPELKRMRRWEIVRIIVRLIVPLQIRLAVFRHLRSA